MLRQRQDRPVLRLSPTLCLAGCILLAAVSTSGAPPKPDAKASKPKTEFAQLDPARGYLTAARQQLQTQEPIRSGHRLKAIDYVNAAIADVELGVKNYSLHHPATARNEAVPAPPPLEAGDRFPHLDGALKLLRHAEAHLREARAAYSPKRVDALAQTRSAIVEVQMSIKDATAGKETHKS